jgi:GT2 family glycosyltransferase
MPSYNHAPFLPAAIDSALAQTYGDLELVIVDDGSTDGSLEIAQGYAERHPDRVRVFTHPGRANLGISATANLAIEQARGRYWSGLPSDDLYHPDKLELGVRYLERHPDVGWVYGYGQYVDEGGRPLPERGLFGTDVTRSSAPVETLVQVNAIPGMTALVRMSCFERAGVHDVDLVYSDWELWVRVAAHCKPGFIPRALVDYRVHTYNTSIGTARAKTLPRHVEVAEVLHERAEQIGGELARPRTRALVALQLAFMRFVEGRHDEAAELVREAASLDPTLPENERALARWLRAWHVDMLHPELSAAEAEEAAQLLAAGPPEPEDPRGERNFSLWLLGRLAPLLDQPRRERLTGLIRALQLSLAAVGYAQSKRLGAAARLGARAALADPRILRDQEPLALGLRVLMGPRGDLVRSRVERMPIIGRG